MREQLEARVILDAVGYFAAGVEYNAGVYAVDKNLYHPLSFGLIDQQTRDVGTFGNRIAQGELWGLRHDTTLGYNLVHGVTEARIFNHVRGDRISQGQSDGWPAYRLEWQKMGSLARRLRACSLGVRADRIDRLEHIDRHGLGHVRICGGALLQRVELVGEDRLGKLVDQRIFHLRHVLREQPGAKLPARHGGIPGLQDDTGKARKSPLVLRGVLQRAQVADGALLVEAGPGRDRLVGTQVVGERNDDLLR